jgi:transcriptional regulator with XRE-family HTH domain
MPEVASQGAGTGLKLLEWRVYRRMSQRQLASRSGVSLATISQIESGKRQPRPATLQRLADALEATDWRLDHEPGDTAGLPPQFIRSLERLNEIVSQLANDGVDGIGFAHLLRFGGRMGLGQAHELWALLGDDLLLFLIGFWREIGEIIASEESDDARAAMDAVLERWRENFECNGIVISQLVPDYEPGSWKRGSMSEGVPGVRSPQATSQGGGADQ